jgi:hypothetical protein
LGANQWNREQSTGAENESSPFHDVQGVETYSPASVIVARFVFNG